MKCYVLILVGRIIYDGKIVQDDQTMAELEVEHYDEFDVFLEREWGSFYPR